MLKKIITITVIAALPALSAAAPLKTLPQMCKELSTAITNQAYQQKDPTCQGLLGQAGSFVGMAGQFIQTHNKKNAKLYLGYADNNMTQTEKLKCLFKDKIKNLHQREKVIARQV